MVEMDHTSDRQIALCLLAWQYPLTYYFLHYSQWDKNGIVKNKSHPAMYRIRMECGYCSCRDKHRKSLKGLKLGSSTGWWEGHCFREQLSRSSKTGWAGTSLHDSLVPLCTQRKDRTNLGECRRLSKLRVSLSW